MIPEYKVGKTEPMRAELFSPSVSGVFCHRVGAPVKGTIKEGEAHKVTPGLYLIEQDGKVYYWCSDSNRIIRWKGGPR